MTKVRNSNCSKDDIVQDNIEKGKQKDAKAKR